MLRKFFLGSTPCVRPAIVGRDEVTGLAGTSLLAARAADGVHDGRDSVARLVRDACASMADGQRLRIMAADEDRDALSDVERHGARAQRSPISAPSATLPCRLATLRGDPGLDASGVDRILVRGFRATMALLLRSRSLESRVCEIAELTR